MERIIRKTLLNTVLASCLTLSANAFADDVYRLRLFFGLSLPEDGAVSLEQWQSFQQDVIATTFEGFNVVDSIGYYKGQAERSKIVTLIVKESEVHKAKEIAAIYAKKFNQDSVMLVKVPVLEWSFVKAKKNRFRSNRKLRINSQ